ncbi:MAG: hypothetical protein H6625_04550 [Bdellovibrionaceae bacterium]|nr:hypothetical protein [Pseudobdellovibrionaceae bacterium]
MRKKSYQLRPGNTKSGVNAIELIQNVFLNDQSQIKRKYKFYDFFRADSAYCIQEIIKELLAKGVHFSITAHDGVTRWKSQMKKQGINWQPWLYSEEEKEKANKRGQKLPRIEVGESCGLQLGRKKKRQGLFFP